MSTLKRNALISDANFTHTPFPAIYPVLRQLTFWHKGLHYKEIAEGYNSLIRFVKEIWDLNKNIKFLFLQLLSETLPMNNLDNAFV